jgi:integrase
MRYSTGYVRKQRGKWIGSWYVNGKRTSKSIGLAKDLTKSEAKEKLAELIKGTRRGANTTLFGPFVEGPYFGFYKRKWKNSTRMRNLTRIKAHLVRRFAERDLASFKRDELQDFLDSKANWSQSLCSKLRWDLKQVFDMAIAEGLLTLNPALLLFPPKDAKRPERKILTKGQIGMLLEALCKRERLMSKLCVLCGMRPGEVFALRQVDVAETFLKVKQRVYEGVVDTPKSDRGIRQIALPAGVAADLHAWISQIGPAAYVFPSEAKTPLSYHNVWQRNMQDKLEAVGLRWANFLVMRRTFLTMSKAMGGDPKVAADQAGHDIGVSMNEYVQSTLEQKLALVNRLEQSLLE